MSYRTDGRHWGSGVCEVNLTGPGWPSQWLGSARSALRAWTSGSSFRFQETPAAANHLAAYDLGRWNGWLGMTYCEPASPKTLLTSTRTLVNTYWEFSPAHPSGHTDTGGAYDLESVLIHELGHMLHLGDESTANQIMAPTLKPLVLRRSLGPDDQAGRAYLYPLLAEFEPADLKKHSVALVRGRIRSTQIAVSEYDFALESDSDSSTWQFVLSTHELSIIEVYTGNLTAGSSVHIVTMGGTTPTRSLAVSGEAVFAPNEEVLLFLTTDYEAVTEEKTVKKKEIYRHTPFYLPNVGKAVGTFSVLGGFQGKYTIYANRGESYIVQQGALSNNVRPINLELFVRSLQ
jgi:hypothetical protein